MLNSGVYRMKNLSYWRIYYYYTWWKWTLVHANSDLGPRALLFVVDSLRRKAGDSAWDTIRSAYRELSCDPSSLGTKTWLRKSLCLDSVILGDSSSSDSELESWLEQKIPLGHVRHREGVEGRWIICKVRWKYLFTFVNRRDWKSFVTCLGWMKYDLQSETRLSRIMKYQNGQGGNTSLECCCRCYASGSGARFR